jgi:predicted nucleic acid-binding protein
MTLVEGLRGSRNAVLDTMVLIYYLEDTERYGDLAESVIGDAEREVFEAIVTPVTAGELLVKPLQFGRPDIADRYRMAMAHLGNTSRCTLSWETGCMAGALRARYDLPLPDMFQVALAMERGSCALVTNDKALGRVEEVPIVLLDDLSN